MIALAFTIVILYQGQLKRISALDAIRCDVLAQRVKLDNLRDTGLSTYHGTTTSIDKYKTFSLRSLACEVTQNSQAELTGKTEWWLFPSIS